MRIPWIVVALALTVSPAAAQGVGGSGVTVIEPARPMGSIEFVQEAGVERWQVKLTGGTFPGGDTYLRISGVSCTQMGEIYQGMITPLYDNMTFKTKNGKTCRVDTIER